jgi:hypothetical protein
LASTNENRDISTLEVVWYETFNDKTKVIPTFAEGQVLQNLMKMEDCQGGM